MRDEDKTREQLIDELQKNRKEMAELKTTHLSEDVSRLFEYIASVEDDYLAFVDKDYIYQSVNHAYLRFWNKSLDEIKGHSVAEMQGSEIFENESKPRLDKALAGQQSQFQRLRYDQSGKPKHMVTTCYPFREKNEITGVIVLTKDITERKQAEEALSRSEMLYRTLAESSPDAIYTLNRDENIQYVNAPGSQWFQTSAENLIGKSIVDILPSHQANLMLQNVRQVFEKKEAFKTERRIFFPTGKRWIQTHLIPVNSPEGEVDIIIGISRDITEHKQAEEKLKKEKDYIESLHNSIGEVIFNVKLPERTIDYVNQSIETIFGYRPDECLGNSTQMLYPDEQGFVEFGKKLEQAIEHKKERLSTEIRYQRKNGEHFFAEVTSTILKQEGVVTDLISIIRDITTRKKAEEQLQISKTVMDKMPIGVVVNKLEDPNDKESFRMISVNQAAAAASLNTRDKMLGKRLVDVFDDISKIGLLEIFYEWVQKKEGSMRFPDTAYEDENIPKGNVFKVEAMYLGGNQVGVFYENITEQRAFEKAQLLHQYLLDYVSDAVISTDKEFRIKTWNKAAETIYGYTAAETIGKVFERVVQIKYPEQPREEVFNQFLENGHWDGKAYQFRKDGMRLLIDAHVSRLLDNDGNEMGVVSVNRDITEKEKLEAQLRHAQKMEALGTLAGGIAHDFNNLLVPVLGLALMVKNKLNPESNEAKHLEMIAESARRAKDLVAQILTVARKAESQMQPLHLKEIFEEALKLLRSTIPTSIAFQQNIDVDLPQIDADPSQIHQVLMNLCVNAAHAMPEGGILTIALNHLKSYRFVNTQGQRVEGAFVCLKVKDTGIGIAANIKEKIFEPFFTTKDKSAEKGTGLGLAVVSGIVEQHGGHIEVESERGTVRGSGGTTFSVYLPISKTKKEETNFAESFSLENEGEHILLVEDEEMVLETGEMLLSDMGYQVSGFNDSGKALQAFEENPKGFDLVITDYMMPKMTGNQLAEKLKAVRPDIPVILCTGYTDIPTKENLEEWNLDGAVTKPYELEKMNQTIRKALAKVKS